MTRQYWANLALCFFLGAFVLFFIARIGSVLTPKGLFVSEPKPSHAAEKLLKDVVLSRYQVGENLNNMIEADFLIQNNSSHSIKNVNVLCEFFDENGMYRDRKSWKLAETVPAQEQRIMSSVSRQFVNTSARALNCFITDFQLVEKPFFSLDRAVGGGHGPAATAGNGQDTASGH